MINIVKRKSSRIYTPSTGYILRQRIGIVKIFHTPLNDVFGVLPLCKGI